MEDAVFKGIIASLSRAIGNDLLSYEKHGNTYVLSIWSPITPDKKELLNIFLRDSMGPKGRVKINARHGEITIWFGKKRD